MGKIEGKVVVITGGASGIGLATARRFVAEGAHAFIFDRNGIDEAVKLIGGNITGVHGDVTNPADLDRLYAKVKEDKGQIDVVFANAGICELGAFGDITEGQFERTFGVNVRGLFFSVQKALPIFRDGGAIILTASSIKGGAAMSVYSASKAAVRSFSRTWTSDLKPRRIRVNTISPGPIDTPMYEPSRLPKEEVERIKSSFVASVPMGRMGTPEEIASVALFLACEDSSFITGIELCVDGGLAQV